MPGIAGIITKQPRSWAEPQLQQMVASLKHESFYASGTCVNEDLSLYIGWVALRGSFAERMPLANEAGNVLLVFSGEEYSEAQAHKPSNNGHGVGNTRTQYLVERAEKEHSFATSLNGRFHGVVVDRRDGAVMLFNDRYGMHRLYYYETKDAFYFAAEAKAILRVRPETRSLDTRAFGELVVCGCTLQNRSLFQGIRVLPPGSCWRFRNGDVEQKSTYFSPREWEGLPELTSENYYQQLREAFERILPRYFAGSQQVGVSLTGGLDSRMIMAWHQGAPGSTPCYSFGGSYRECQDVVIARRVARTCRETHKVIPVAGEFLAKFARYAERTVYLTDGCVSVSHSPDLFVNERARQIAPVRMTGNYGGEVLRRVRAFKSTQPLPGLFRGDLWPSFEGARRTYNDAIHTHPLSFAVFRQAPWHHYGLLSLEQTQLALRSPFLDNDLVKLVFQAPDWACADNEVSLRLIRDGNPNLSAIRTDRGLAGNHNRILSAWNHAYLEFTYKAEYAYDYGMPQWVAKVDHAFAKLRLERLFLGRQKFYHFRVWYRDQLAKHVKEVLLDAKSLSRPYLNRRTVQAIVAGHLKGDQNFTTEIHSLLTLEYIQRLFVENSCTSAS